MAKEAPDVENTPKTREFNTDERVQTYKDSPQHDLFEDILEGKSAKEPVLDSEITEDVGGKATKKGKVSAKIANEEETKNDAKEEVDKVDESEEESDDEGDEEEADGDSDDEDDETKDDFEDDEDEDDADEEYEEEDNDKEEEGDEDSEADDEEDDGEEDEDNSDENDGEGEEEDDDENEVEEDEGDSEEEEEVTESDDDEGTSGKAKNRFANAGKNAKGKKERDYSKDNKFEAEGTEREEGVSEEDVALHDEDDDDDSWIDTLAEDAIAPTRDIIRKTILEKASVAAAKDTADAQPVSSVPLTFLEDPEKGNVFIGRKKGIWKKFGYEGALHIGKVIEEGYPDKSVYLDSLNPHVVFVCGARGSGKSYVLGVMAEELARQNPNIGTVVIDPVGVFWSMKYPNKEEREVKMLADWSLEPEGLDNLKVFIPEGCKDDTPKSTYDATYSLPPTMLTAEDWALTFGIERFSPTGLLLDIALKKVKEGYKNKDGKIVKGKRESFTLEDIIKCMQTDHDLNSREKGYKPDSVRALVSRFEAARSWGVFSEKGTPLSELSREGQLTIIDTSFLDDNVTALVVGILARRLLAARKITTRKEAAKRFKEADVKKLLETDIPPTWLYIDEAHTLIPSGTSKTPATDAIVEYVKQGRRPGCSLVFATQQPSAIDSKVLSQLDILLAHKLVFDDDIKAIYRRVPTIVPSKYKKATFIKTLPIGTGLTADRSEETSRAFLMKIRPRKSQHEGREAEATERSKQELSDTEASGLMVEMIVGNLEKEGNLSLVQVEDLVASLNKKYKVNVKNEDIIAALEEKGMQIEDDTIMHPDAEVEEDEEEDAEGDEEGVEEDEDCEGEDEEEGGEDDEREDEGGEEEDVPMEFTAIPFKIKEPEAFKTAHSKAKGRFFGLLGKAESVEEVRQTYSAVWKVTYDVFKSAKEFMTRDCYIDSQSGEFLHYKNTGFVESNGLQVLSDLGDDELSIIRVIAEKQKTSAKLADELGFSEGKTRRLLDKLIENGFVGRFAKRKGEDKIVLYGIKMKLDLPPTETHVLLGSVGQVPTEKVTAIAKERERIGKKEVSEIVKKVWPQVVVKHVEEVYRPLYRATLADSNGARRTFFIDGFTGKVLK